jgi:uncharacterized repeat protein (TIGR02543 family)
MKRTSFRTIFPTCLVTALLLLQTGTFLAGETEAASPSIELRLTVDVSPHNSGTVKVFGATAVYEYPQLWNIYSPDVQLEAIPSPGYTFSNWSGALTGEGNPTTLHVDHDQSVTANFTPLSAGAPKLYFPHVLSHVGGFPDIWETEVCLINTTDQTLTGTLTMYQDDGHVSSIKAITLAGHERWSRIVGAGGAFVNPFTIGYMVFESASGNVVGYTKFYIEGRQRTAIPAVKAVNTSDICIPHIASTAEWSTWLSLVNTTATEKTVTINFNDGQTKPVTIAANGHWTRAVSDLFNSLPQPRIQSAVITNASGIIGLELFGASDQMDGILLTDKTASTVYYPHMAGGEWWTGVVAYNPSELASTIIITPYSAQGTPLPPANLSIAGGKKYIGAVTALGLPAETAWFRIDATRPLSGFELFGTVDGKQLAPYAGAGGTGAKAGVFAKIEKNGWTGIAFVNTEDSAASVALTAYDDNGDVVATKLLSVGGHAKVVNPADAIFLPQDTSNASYIAYSSDRYVVGFQLNGSADWTMLDGLPGM